MKVLRIISILVNPEPWQIANVISAIKRDYGKSIIEMGHKRYFDLKDSMYTEGLPYLREEDKYYMIRLWTSVKASGAYPKNPAEVQTFYPEFHVEDMAGNDYLLAGFVVEAIDCGKAIKRPDGTLSYENMEEEEFVGNGMTQTEYEKYLFNPYDGKDIFASVRPKRTFAAISILIYKELVRPPLTGIAGGKYSFLRDPGCSGDEKPCLKWYYGGLYPKEEPQKQELQ